MFGLHFSRLGSVNILGLVPRALAILRSYGADAHVYLPGVGTVNGITAGNYLDSAGTTAASVDNPVGKVTDGFGGLHATQGTTANKPILRRGLLNLIAYSDDQSNAAWSKTDTSPTTGQIGASGLTTATLLTEGSAGSAFTVITGTSVPAGSPITERIRLKRGNTDIVRIDLLDSGSSNGAQCWVNLATRTILSTIAVGTGSGVSSEIDSGENGYYWLTLRATPSATSTATRLGICSASANSSYTRVAGATYYIDRAGILQGTYTAQQILDAGGIPLTTTAAASNANAGKYSWQFDQSNDFLQTAITTGDVGWFCSGVTFTDSNSTLFCSGAGSAAQKGLWAYREALSDMFVTLIGNGTAPTSATAISAPAGQPLVIAAGWDASNIFHSVNNTENTATRTGSASPSPANLRIGAYTDVTTYPLGGNMNIALVFDVLPTATERLTLKRWVGQISGVSL